MSNSGPDRHQHAGPLAQALMPAIEGRDILPELSRRDVYRLVAMYGLVQGGHVTGVACAATTIADEMLAMD